MTKGVRNMLEPLTCQRCSSLAPRESDQHERVLGAEVRWVDAEVLSRELEGDGAGEGTVGLRYTLDVEMIKVGH